MINFGLGVVVGIALTYLGTHKDERVFVLTKVKDAFADLKDHIARLRRKG